MHFFFGPRTFGRYKWLFSVFFLTWVLLVRPGLGQELLVLPELGQEEVFKSPDDQMQETLLDVREQIDSLELAMAGLEEKVGGRTVVHAMDAAQLDLGGFLTQSETTINSDDNFRSSFDLTQFEIFLSGEVTEKLTFFTVLEFKRKAPINTTNLNDVTFDPFGNDAELELAWINYKHSDWIQYRVGRFVAPHGIINIEHFQPVLFLIDYPMFMRQGASPAFFERFMIGTQMHGQKFLETGHEDDQIQYAFYTASQKESGDRFLFGGRIERTWGCPGLTVGLNYGHGRHGPEIGGNEYDFGGLDILLKRERLIWKTEFYVSDEHQANRTNTGGYTQPAWEFCSKRWLFYRFDYLDKGTGIPTQTEHVLGINYLPSHVLRLRLSLVAADFQNQDDNQRLRFSVTTSF